MSAWGYETPYHPDRPVDLARTVTVYCPHPETVRRSYIRARTDARLRLVICDECHEIADAAIPGGLEV
jgi:Rad3-related DNA helicase